MAGGKEKVFKDAVHGYIRVPSRWCRLFIDTPLFQRLRHIEQTSMRCLYPSARHDRFVHSLGVYHLGRMAFSSLLRNAKPLITELGLNSDEIGSLRKTFLIACLLHDCAHAPFSHTFEKYYEHAGRLNAALVDAMSSDFDAERDLSQCNPAPHEKASAAAILNQYADGIRAVGGEPCLAARMVLGCEYHHRDGPKLRFCNALISLLNGKAIDVDKLDYITRDTWASGVANVSIDLDRLLQSVTVVMHPSPIVRIAYQETALSVLQSVVDARNYLYTWIYGHHKVIYDQHLLTTAVERVIQELSPSGLETVFSSGALLKPVQLGQTTLFCPADGDLIHLLKSYGRHVKEAREWLSRKHTRTALWKTAAQHSRMFEKLNESGLNNIEKALFDEKRRLQWWKSANRRGTPVVKTARIRLYEIHENDVLVELSRSGAIICYTDAAAERAKRQSVRMPTYFLYLPKSELRDEDALVKAIIGLA
jgi:HD superfamily phosphohydrolase